MKSLSWREIFMKIKKHPQARVVFLIGLVLLISLGLFITSEKKPDDIEEALPPAENPIPEESATTTATSTPVQEESTDTTEEKPISPPPVIPKEATPTPIVKPIETSLFSTKSMLDGHNKIRIEDGVPLLTWSPSLAKGAQKWSDVLKSENCVFRHDPNRVYGENIYWAWKSGSLPDGLISKPTDATTWWADEKEFYNYSKNTCASGEQCGHYTQMVWEDTTEVGCAVSSCIEKSKQTDVWVCRYNPPGNMNGARPF